MQRFVPLASFEHDTQPVVAVDDDGSVRLVNRAARRLLGLSASESLPEQCWELAEFLAPDGTPFCSPDCPVQREAREGVPSAQHWVVGSKGDLMGRMVELVSFVVPTSRTKRHAVLHFLRPVVSNRVERVSDAAEALDPRIGPACGLTEREEEVLRLIAEGLSTTSVAQRLGITTTTVRNHVQNILRKMGVHRRIEAVVAFGRAVAAAFHE